MPAIRPEGAYGAFEREIALLRSAERTGEPTSDPASPYFGVPQDDFLRELRELRDEIEERAYLAIVSATEGVVQVDFRARFKGRATWPLQAVARRLRKEERRGRRIVLEDVLDAWANLPDARRPISEFKQLLPHRHWLAHGRYWDDLRGSMPDDPNFALHRSLALLAELHRLDPAFPRATE